VVAFRYHPPALKTSNSAILDKPGKASYDRPASFHIIVLLKTVSKILKRVMTVRLSAIAHSKGLLHLTQCSSLLGISASDTSLFLPHEVKILQRPRLRVSTLFLDIKAGFDNINASTLRASLLAKRTPSYMIDLVSSFLSERSCTLVFQDCPNLPAPVLVGRPQGSLISPLLLLLYIAPLHFAISSGIMLFYIDNFSIPVASDSHRGNIRHLRRTFRGLAKSG